MIECVRLDVINICDYLHGGSPSRREGSMYGIAKGCAYPGGIDKTSGKLSKAKVCLLSI